MITETFTSGQLIDALKAGKTLVRLHDKSENAKETLSLEGGRLFNYGWGTAYGSPEGRLLGVFNHPENWSIEND